MTPQEIVEGDKLIDAFDCGDGEGWNDKDWLTKCRYHKSWDWLMPVVDKIEEIEVTGYDDIRGEQREVEWQFSVEIMNSGCVIHRDMLPQYYGTETDFLELYDCLNTDKLTSTWKAVVTFIKWYNKHGKSN